MTDPQPPSSPSRARLIPRDPSERLRIIATGRRRYPIGDMYVRLLAASWKRLILTIAVAYLALNVLFADGYMLLGDHIENARPHNFADLFFFSIQTFATIGYGRMIPVGTAANLLVTAEAMTGFLFYAIATGLVFSKFSPATSRVMFSKFAIVSNYDGQRHLMLRLANERGNRIVDATVHMILLRNVVTVEGHSMRRFYDMRLTRSTVPLLQLSWTAMHPIDDQSPLHGLTLDALRQADAEIIVTLTGLDETFSQPIHARYSYMADEVVFDAMFEDVIKRTPQGIELHFEKFHDIRPLPPIRVDGNPDTNNS